jgi:hypothetical protein
MRIKRENRAASPRATVLPGALVLLICISCTSCSTDHNPAPARSAEEHKTASWRGAVPILLPSISVPGVKADHALQPEEVTVLSSEYFRRFVCGCGMPDRPVDKGEYWKVQLWGGIVGTDYGQFLISKDGRRVTLEPPRSGLRSSTRSLLSHSGVHYE